MTQILIYSAFGVVSAKPMCLVDIKDSIPLAQSIEGDPQSAEPLADPEEETTVTE